jgi:DNA-binding transcriptional MerR regulator
MELTFSIAEISKETNLSYDTIRYYEKLGLISSTKSKENGRRIYTKRDLDRFKFVTHLKRTSMPLKEIKRYMTLTSDLDYDACYHILFEHKGKIEAEIHEMQATLDILKYKLDHFQELMKRSGLGGE